MSLLAVSPILQRFALPGIVGILIVALALWLQLHWLMVIGVVLLLPVLWCYLVILCFYLPMLMLEPLWSRWRR